MGRRLIIGVGAYNGGQVWDDEFDTCRPRLAKPLMANYPSTVRRGSWLRRRWSPGRWETLACLHDLALQTNRFCIGRRRTYVPSALAASQRSFRYASQRYALDASQSPILALMCSSGKQRLLFSSWSPGRCECGTMLARLFVWT